MDTFVSTYTVNWAYRKERFLPRQEGLDVQITLNTWYALASDVNGDIMD